jgi:hypothetical protein
VETRFAASVAGRVELFVTRYKSQEGEVGRWAIRFDGREIEGLSERSSRWRQERLETDSRSSSEAAAIQRSEGTHDLHQFYRALKESLNLSVEDAMASPDVLIRSIALLDRRMGKRRLRQLSRSGQPPLEAACLAFRCRAEKTDPDRPGDPRRSPADHRRSKTPPRRRR